MNMTRNLLLKIKGLILCLVLQAQNAGPAKSDFAFWIGEWETEASNAPTWNVNYGNDRVRYLLDSTLIEEIFEKKRRAKHQFPTGIFSIPASRKQVASYDP